MSVDLIHVMVGAISDRAGRVLVTKRPDHVHQGGLWEFPGGKLEPGESPEQGLARELAEELGIEVHDSRPLIRIRHHYGDRHVLLDVRRVRSYAGVPAGLEGQPLAWQRPETMDPACFPAADRPIITALRLPGRMLITGLDPLDPEVFLARLARAVAGGIKLVQLRAHELNHAAYRDLARRAFLLCEQGGARLLLNRNPRQTLDVPRHGLHLGGQTLARLSERPGRPDDLVGASCHNADDLVRAARLGLDYALLSPVNPTASHPDAEPLGWHRFAELADAATLPVYALGGLNGADLEVAREHGAQGVAAIRGLWPID
ncbi:Mutator MutT protein [Thiocapsa sp. KS1]|nr:Mutator MutT protein [Thiocapsa sp. KS1]